MTKVEWLDRWFEQRRNIWSDLFARITHANESVHTYTSSSTVSISINKTNCSTNTLATVCEWLRLNGYAIPPVFSPARTHAHTHTRQVRRGDPRTIRTAGIPACSPIKLSYLCTRLLVIWRRECGRWYVCQQSVSTRRQRQSMDVADSRYYSHQYECIFVVRAERAMLLSSRLLGHAFVPLSTSSWRLLTLIFCMFVKEHAEVTCRITFVQNYAHRLSCRRVEKSKSVFLSNLGQILFHTGLLTGSWHFYFGKML